MPLVSDRQEIPPRLWTILVEAVSSGRAALSGGGIFLALLGAAYIFSAASKLHFVHYLDAANINLLTSFLFGAFVGVISHILRVLFMGKGSKLFED